MAFSGITKLISQLTATTSISDTDNLIVGNTDAKKITWAQIIALIKTKLNIGSTSISGIGDGTVTGAIKKNADDIDGLNGNMNWSDAITLGSTYGIEMKYRYNAKFVEIEYGGTLPGGVGFGAGTNGYEFPSMPEEFLPVSNIRQPIFCPGNGNKLCIRIYPWATDKWSIAPGSIELKSVQEYIAGTFVYARR